MLFNIEGHREQERVFPENKAETENILHIHSHSLWGVEGHYNGKLEWCRTQRRLMSFQINEDAFEITLWVTNLIKCYRLHELMKVTAQARDLKCYLILGGCVQWNRQSFLWRKSDRAEQIRTTCPAFWQNHDSGSMKYTILGHLYVCSLIQSC